LSLRRSLAVAATALVAACSGADAPSPFAVTYDPCRAVELVPAETLSPVQRQSIDDAIAMWRAVLPPAALPGDDAGAVALPIAFEDAAPFFHGIYLPDEGRILINSGIAEPHALAVTVAHELGHAFGLPHADEPGLGSVMLRGNYEIEPAEIDARALAELWGDCASPAPLSIAP
jgi:hypothetical protein